MRHFSAFATVLILAPANQIIARQDNTDAHAKRIESVLDRLEKRLIDKESSPLTTEENDRIAADAKSSVNASQQADQKYVPKAPAKIKGQTQAGRNLQELQKKINEYDSRIEILESDMRKLSSTTQDNGTTDNVVSLQIKTDSERPVVMKTLAATLDGQTLYSQIDPAGLWIPSKIISLFYGPLKPGSHRLEITSTVSTTTDEATAAGSWKQKALSQTFEFTVPEGKQRKSITVEIGQSANGGGTPTATMFESEAK